MAVLDFTLSEEGVAVFHDALGCIVKFSDDVCLEARKDKLTLTTLNLSKSAYVCFTFAANRFFSRYKFEGTEHSREKFSCQMYLRSLMSVFRARQSGDSVRDRDRETVTDRCDVSIEDGVNVKSRLVARIYFRNGITTTHALPFEAKNATHAKFVKDEAVNSWTISSRTLRQLMDHFGPGIELLDINTDDENRVANFTCFTEKVARTSTSHEEVLKKPLHTSIAVNMDEFDEIEVQDKMHIIISVKDFRNILQHAQTTIGALSSFYSNPGKPMKLSYSTDGFACDFILMTVSEKDPAVPKPKKGARENAATPVRQGLEAASTRQGSVAASRRDVPPSEPLANKAPSEASRSAKHRMPVGLRPGPSQFQIRPEAMPPSTTLRSESLFVSQHEEEAMWEPVNPDEEEDELDNSRLEWAANKSPTASTMLISNHLPALRENPQAKDKRKDQDHSHLVSGLDPTQRLEDVRQFGLFS